MKYGEFPPPPARGKRILLPFEFFLVVGYSRRGKEIIILGVKRAFLASYPRPAFTL